MKPEQRLFETFISLTQPFGRTMIGWDELPPLVRGAWLAVWNESQTIIKEM